MPEAVSFKGDIRPMFTDMDIEHMRKAMDLSSRASVFVHADAIYKAVGVRMRQLPMSPGRVTKAMLQRKG